MSRKAFKLVLSLFCMWNYQSVDVTSQNQASLSRGINELLPHGNVLTESKTECAMKCQSTWSCISANFLVETGTCYLFSNTFFSSEDAIGWHYLYPLKRTFHHISNQTATWNDAKSYCESIGGGLANIYSPADNEMLRNIISQSQENRAWIGGSDIESEGDWIWTNGCKFNDQDFNFWRTGNPNNMYGSENCLELWNFEWNDQLCHILLTFVCEIDVA